MLGFGDTEARSENYIRLDYIPAVLSFSPIIQKTIPSSMLIRLEGPVSRKPAHVDSSQTVQLMTASTFKRKTHRAAWISQVNLDVAGRTQFDIYNTPSLTPRITLPEKPFSPRELITRTTITRT